MTPTALLLLTISTFSHALWNFLGKRRDPSPPFFWIASLAASGILSPILLYYARALPFIPGLIWLLLLCTGGCQAIYYIGLAGAYKNGDLSVAYPLARALPALFVTGVTTAFGLGKPVSLMGSIGIFGVVLGCLLVPLPRLRSLRARNYLNLCCLMALLAAFGTTGYTIIDSEALSQLRAVPNLKMTAAEISILFMVLEDLSITLVLGIFILLSTKERSALSQVNRAGWRYAALTGLIISSTYGLVLVSMAFVNNISYLSAYRNLSIPLGALLGITIQKEPAYPPKILGILIVLVGLVLVGLS